MFNFTDLPVQIVGFDISKDMVQEGMARYRAERKAAKVSFFIGDASFLPFEDRVFDFVLGYGVLHHLPDPPKTCQEIARVLKPGGIYFGSENNETILRSLFDLLQRLRPAWNEEAGKEPLISSAMLKDWFGASLAVETRSHVFLPPHLVNLVGPHLAGGFLQTTDLVFRLSPLRGHGGLITFTGRKPPAPAQRLVKEAPSISTHAPKAARTKGRAK